MPRLQILWIYVRDRENRRYDARSTSKLGSVPANALLKYASLPVRPNGRTLRL